MSLSVEQTRQLWVSLFPPGIALEFDPSAVIGGTVLGLAQAAKQVLLDRIEQLHLELNPSTMIEKIPDWELACGLTNTPIAKFGSIDQRRNAVIAVLRTSGSFSYDDIRAIVQPYFLYADPAAISIIETSRAVLRAANTYSYTVTTTVTAASTRTLSVAVADNPRVSPAGAHLGINLEGYVGDITLTLIGPDGFQVTFPPGTFPPRTVTDVQYDLVALGFAGRSINGLWTLQVRTNLTYITINSWSVFAEGIGNIYDTAIPPNKVGEGAGASIFQFAVVADAGLLGDGYDLQGAQRSLTRWKPAHTGGIIATGTGTACAIPDTMNAIPDNAIAC